MPNFAVIMENKTIAPQKVVSLAYELTLSNGNLADEASADEPLVFIHGIGQTLPAFDERINGLSVGDKFSFSLTSEEGYGETNPNFIVDIPKNIFEGPDVPKDILQVGASLPMQDQEGNPMDGTVMEIGDETVKMDFNHPLAGEALNFKGSVVAIRDASQEELDHGHVHGEGGVQH
jgi:FKBP-type peptidyl-prolyl cis-trans isomerase SlyD